MFIFMRLDALTIAKDGTLMNFEMQNERKAGMEQQAEDVRKLHKALVPRKRGYRRAW